MKKITGASVQNSRFEMSGSPRFFSFVIGPNITRWYIQRR